jgi:uncharacterized protein YdeI (YjbR/CyaY-like superfamily)
MAPVVVDPKRIRAFETERAFETRLAKHHDKHTELWIRIYKKDSGVPSITPAQAIDVVLCWGWIDGQRKGYDALSFLQRYTPRRAKSLWSEINRDNVARLTAQKRMTPHGLRHVETAKADGRWAAAYKGSRTMTMPEDLMRAIAADKRAAAMFEKLDKQNRFALAFRVGNLRTAAGREKKIASYVAMLRRGETIHPMKTAAPAKRRKTAPSRRAK